MNTTKKIYPNFGEPEFKYVLLWELSSLIGRHFLKSRSKIKPTSTPLLVDLGVGTNFKEGWTHVGFYCYRLKFWKKYYNIPEIQSDLEYPLNCADSIVDGVYSGHTLEHLYPKLAYQLLSEIFRVLKPKCWLRINVPDLKRAIDFYKGTLSIPEYQFKAEAISHLTQDWGHHSVWDEELLSYALKATGFINVKKVEFGIDGTDKRLIKEQEIRKEGTIVFEAQKP